MTDRPSLLFLAHLVPYPPDAGAPIRTWHLLKELAQGFSVDGLFLARRGATVHPDAREALGRVCSATVLTVGAGPLGTRAGAQAASLARDRPYTEFLYGSDAAGRRLDALLATGDPSLVHVESIDLVGYLPRVAGRPFALGHHSVESEMLERRSARASNPLARAAFARQGRLVARAERRWSPRAAVNVCVSERDAAELRRRAPGSDTVVAPNGVDVEYFRPDGADAFAPDGAVAFLGGADWAPNLDAVRYFAAEVEPLLPEALRGRLVSIGRAAGRRDLPREVRWTGYVEDVRPHLRDAGVVAVPLRTGGGTRLKILTAWAMGKPVVSTTLGAEGLEARPGRNVLLADDPETFARAVTRVLTEPEVARRLGADGRRTVEQSYDWRLVGAGLRAAYAERMVRA